MNPVPQVSCRTRCFAGDTRKPVDIQLHDTSRAYEERWFTLDVPKEQAIMERFGCSTTRYYQRLNNLIDDPAALGYKPLLVKRLRRQRAQRQAARSARRLQS